MASQQTVGIVSGSTFGCTLCLGERTVKHNTVGCCYNIISYIPCVCGCMCGGIVWFRLYILKINMQTLNIHNETSLPPIGLLPNTQNCGLPTQRIFFFPPPRVNDPGMHHGTCVTHVLWCIPGSLAGAFLWIQWKWKVLGACATRNFTYLVRGLFGKGTFSLKDYRL